MLPTRCITLPCMNIDRKRDLVAGPTPGPSPGVSIPGLNAQSTPPPAPICRANTTTQAMMIPTLTIGKVRDGMLSRSGSIGLFQSLGASNRQHL